jgi:3,4-dihydroxy 2-butanone 4-phosphate synthase/GTP cyclohydrolase II
MSESSITKLFDDVKSGRLAILQDDVQGVARAILVAPAHEISADEVNRLITLSGGIVFAGLAPERAAAFLLDPMGRPRVSATEQPCNFSGPNFCISVEAREGVTTGISAADRAVTLRILGAPEIHPRKLVQPGHIFPVEVRAGGVLVKNALPEGAVDIVSLAGFTGAAAFIDLLDDAGNLILGDKVDDFAHKHSLPLFRLSELTRYRLETEKVVYRVAEAKLPTKLAGELRSIIYKSTIHGGEHLALVKGDIDPTVPLLTRVQPENTFADVFGGDSPASREQLQRCLEEIGRRGHGVIVYLRRPSSGELHHQIDTATQQSPPGKALMREYGLGAQILRDLGARKIELLTGTKKDLVGLQSFGLEIVSQTPLPSSTPPPSSEQRP